MDSWQGTPSARSHRHSRVGTWGTSERDQLRLEARALGAAVELHYLFAPVDVLLGRIQRRGIEIPPIERATLARWAEAFQAPTPELALFDETLLSARSHLPTGVHARSSADSTCLATPNARKWHLREFRADRRRLVHWSDLAIGAALDTTTGKSASIRRS